jgi:hypothetical protein
MAHIVLGMGTSHSPLLAIGTDLWRERASDDRRKSELYLADGRVVSFAELNTEVQGGYSREATPEHFEEQAADAQKALDRLAAAIAGADLDALIIVGDDQGELFSRSSMPAIAVFTGDEIATHPKNEVDASIPAWYREANRGYLMDHVHRYPAHPELAGLLVDGMIGHGVDAAVVSAVPDPRAAGFGHAYGFVIDRLIGESRVPVVPVLLNTYFQPNVPRPGRCYDIGQVIADAVHAWPGDARVGVAASGGLTHFAVDEAFDREVVRSLTEDDAGALRSLPHLGLRSGNSEILNWVMVGGAVRDLAVTYSEYIPVRRTEAGTGIGLGFMAWQAPR